MLEEKRLDGLIQTPPIRVVVIELLVTPKPRNAGVAIIGQRFSDFLEAFVQRILECLRRELRADHEDAA